MASSFLTLLLLLLTAGCSLLPDRISHYHSDANLKLTQDASDNFEQFTGQTAGLSSVLDNNLEARRGLEETVANATLQVLDNELAKITTDVSWVRLRAQTLQSVGLIRDDQDQPIQVMDPHIDDNQLWGMVMRDDPLLPA